MSKQVQLRGGTKDEHRQFIGAEREVTVDTSKNTLRVHDGYTYGGTVLATEDFVYNNIDEVHGRIDDVVGNIAEAHNHDDLYVQLVNGSASNLTVDNVKLVGRDILINGKRALVGFDNQSGNRLVVNYDNDYGNGVVINGNVDIPNNLTVKGRRPLLDHHINGYYGICTPDADDVDWIRSTKNGFIPYQSGGYSSIGTSSWRFSRGYFDNVDTKSITVAKNGNTSSIDFPATVNDPGFIRHIENNNSAGMYFSVSDDDSFNDAFYFGASPSGQFKQGAWISADGHMWLHGYLRQDWSVMNIGGRHVYFDGSRPSDAPEGSISFG